MVPLDRPTFDSPAAKEIYQYVERHGTAARHQTRTAVGASADDFQEEVHENADHMNSILLDLASILRKAKYDAGNEFRQPPNAWEPGIRHPGFHEQE